MKVISFISRKGGTGKTTNAINLATMLFSLGYKLELVETDTNYTLNTLRQMELFKTGAKDSAIFGIKASVDGELPDIIQPLRDQNTLDYLVVDSAGKTTDEHIKKLALMSDAIVIPTSLTQNDLLVTFQTVEDLKPAKEINEYLKILILPNRIHSSTKLPTIKEALAELDAHVLEVKIPAKNIFANFSTIMPEKSYLETTKAIIDMV